MTRSRPPFMGALFAILAWFFSMVAATAQSVGPDEAVGADGSPGAPLALTAGQKNAIYNAVMGDHARASAKIPVAIGAPISPTTPLAGLPRDAVADNPSVTDLKYALVDGDIIVVDPVGMRVVDVIHASGKP
jgi:hypothetical protein